MLIQKRFLK